MKARPAFVQLYFTPERLVDLAVRLHPSLKPCTAQVECNVNSCLAKTKLTPPKPANFASYTAGAQHWCVECLYKWAAGTFKEMYPDPRKEWRKHEK